MSPSDSAGARWWDDRVLPRLVDVALADRVAGQWRRELCADVAGEVLEVGFGSGRNLGFYPPAVSAVLAVEPSDLAWERARPRVKEFGRRVERIGLDGASLAGVGDASVDAVVSAWTLCSIPDLPTALAEMRRVLRPEGRLHFVEHSLAPDPGVARAQRALQPAWGRLAGGCHLDRDIPAELVSAGLVVADLRSRFVARGPARPWTWFCSGSASA